MGESEQEAVRVWLGEYWWLIPLGILFVIIVLGVLGRANQQSARRKYLNDPKTIAWREKLLDFVVEESSNQKEKVPLRRFWKRNKIRGRRRYFVLKPLLDNKTLYIAQKPEKSKPEPKDDGLPAMLAAMLDDAFDAMIKGIDGWLNRALCIPPDSVVLSDRTWLRIRNGEATTHQVTIESVKQMQYFGENSSVGNAMMAGEGISDSSQRSTHTNVNTADHLDKLHELHIALLTDARKADPDEAVIIRKLANELQGVLNDDQGAKDDRLQPLMKRIKGATSTFSGAMNTTASALTVMKETGIL
ncbi:hypothetical protein [Kocuria rosea]|uniref:hypothetical protein n=1 Tax=Kocuria rosea TaxID=1275 RepID=UPI000A90B2CF|nr:hypothetical protein [Kocuria polaris]